MKSKLLIALFASVLFFGCGEAGFESDISKNIELDPVSVQLSIDPLLIGQFVPQLPPVVESTGVIDLVGEDFGSYLDDSQSFRINQITYAIDNFPANSSTDLLITVDVAVAGGQFQNLLSTNLTNPQGSISDVLLYSRTNPGTTNTSVIGQLEQALLNGQSFELRVETSASNVVLQTSTIDFDLLFKFDVTTRIQLN